MIRWKHIRSENYLRLVHFFMSHDFTAIWHSSVTASYKSLCDHLKASTGAVQLERYPVIALL